MNRYKLTVDFILKHPAIIVASIWEMRCNQERKKWAQELYNSTCVKIPMVAKYFAQPYHTKAEKLKLCKPNLCSGA